MAKDSEPMVPSTVKDLANALSVQNKLSNQVWLVLVVFSALIILPAPNKVSEHNGDPCQAECACTGTETSGKDPASKGGEASKMDNETTTRKIPGLGDVPSRLFDIAAYFILCALTIYFCQALAQAINIHRKAHSVIDNLEKNNTNMIDISRQYLENLSVPAFTRTVSLPNLLEESCFKVLSLPYYIVLRGAALFVVLGLPTYALWIGYEKIFFEPTTEIDFGIWGIGSFVGMVTLLALIHVWWEEFRQTSRKLEECYGIKLWRTTV